MCTARGPTGLGNRKERRGDAAPAAKGGDSIRAGLWAGESQTESDHRVFTPAAEAPRRTGGRGGRGAQRAVEGPGDPVTRDGGPREAQDPPAPG